MRLSPSHFGEEKFESRHMGADPSDLAAMLATVGAVDLDDLTRQTVPEVIALTEALSIDEGLSEQAALRTLRELAAKNEVGRSAILLVLDRDPLVDPLVLAEPSEVWSRGRRRR